MLKKQITQKDVARELGLNHSTVSLALRNSKKISKERRELIQKTAVKMGYRLNAAAANLAKHRQVSADAPVEASLGWLNCWPNPKQLRELREFELYWSNAKETAARFGYSLEEFVVENEMSLERVQGIMEARGIQGVLIPPHPPGVDLSAMNWDNFSILRFGRSVEAPAAHFVTADQLGNMLLAFEEVMKRGYKRIGMVDHRRLFSFDAGYLKAQEVFDVEERLPICHLEDTDDPQLRLDRFRAWLDKERPDAVISATSGVSKLLNESGYRIGVDIGLAATSILDTSIDAGIYQNSEEIGRVASLALISQVQDNDTGVPELYRQTLIPGRWVDGKSLPARECLTAR